MDIKRDKLKKTGDWVRDVNNVLSDSSETISNISFCLSDLASALSRAGNDKVAEEIWGYTRLLRPLSVTLQKAAGKLVSGALHDAEQSSRNTFLGALAGVELATRSAKEKKDEVE